MFFPNIILSISLSVLLLSFREVHTINLLLFGDSVDGQTVNDWCSVQKHHGLNVTDKIWGGSSLVYKIGKRGRMATHICRIFNRSSVAYVHMFGSRSHGPYHKYMNNSLDDPYVDTAVRIDYSYKVYCEQFGMPDRIFLQFANWDVQRILREVSISAEQKSDMVSMKPFISEFTNNMIERINQLRLLINGTSIELGLRTAVWAKAGQLLLREFNKVIRDLAISHNLMLFDFDEDVWSIVQHDYSQEPKLFKDFVHPVQHYTAVAGEKMLGEQYSALMHFSHYNSYHQHHERFMHFYLHQNIIVFLFRSSFHASDKIFYYNRYEKTFHPLQVHDDFIRIIRLGKEDILNVTFDPYKTLSEGSPISSCFSNKRIITFTDNNDQSRINGNHHNFYIQQHTLRKIPSLEVSKELENLVKIPSSKSCEVDMKWLHNILPEISFGPEISHAFNTSENTLVRYEKSRSVFIIKNKIKNHVGSVGALTSIGKTFDDVIVFKNEDDVALYDDAVI